MSRREQKETVNRGCNCLIVLVIVFAFAVSGVRSLINGDIKLPRFGSSHVSGGSGGYGTSNGYNVQYKQSTSPNSNSSLKDYTETNSEPTEYREGRSRTESKAAHNTTISSSNNARNYSNYNTEKRSETYYKTCTACRGTGKRQTFHCFNENVMGSSCLECGRTDSHRHDEIVTCEFCSGKGRILMEKVNGPLDEMEVQHFDW